MVIFCLLFSLSSVYGITLVSFSSLCRPSMVFILSPARSLAIHSLIASDCWKLLLQTATERLVWFGLVCLGRVGSLKSIEFQWCRIYMLWTTINFQTINGDSIETVHSAIVLCLCSCISKVHFQTHLQSIHW